MGVEYGIFNHRDRTYFDMGKGPWEMDDTEFLVAVRNDQLEEWIFTCVTHRGHWKFESELSRAGYVIDLAAKIKSAMLTNGTRLEHLEILSDAGDRYYDLTQGDADEVRKATKGDTATVYTEVGSRYADLDAYPEAEQEVADALAVRAVLLYGGRT